MKFLLLLTLLFATVFAYGKLNGSWEGSGEYNGHGTLTEPCSKMVLKINIAPQNALINYHFICKSFEFIDSIHLERQKKTFFQKGIRVGGMNENDKKSMLVLKDIQFEHFGGPLNVNAVLNVLTGKLEYSDALIYQDGLSDSFKAILTKQ